MKRFNIAIASLIALSCAGCGGSGIDLGQVTGTVMSEGKPVPNLSIEFFPAEGRPSLARTDAEGKFTAYFLPNEPGAEPGKHRLESEFAQAGPDTPQFERPKRRGKGASKPLVLSPREIEVVAGETVELKLNLVEEA